MSSSDLGRRAARALFVRRVALLARAAGARVTLDVALDVRVGRGLTVTVEPGSVNHVRLGPGVRLGDRTVLQLKGGRVDVGGWTELRRGAVLNVSGDLRIGEACTIGLGSVLHCSTRIEVGDRVGLGEYVSLIDSSHVLTTPGRPFAAEIRRGAVTVGDDTLLGAKATLTRSAEVGSYCVVGAGSVVVGRVPDRTFVSGVPAVRVGEVDVPWER